ncbi:hypothetical protein J7L48_04765 [bacterium]|nr:hypothetical protein [bacterium]
MKKTLLFLVALLFLGSIGFAEKPAMSGRGDNDQMMMHKRMIQNGMRPGERLKARLKEELKLTDAQIEKLGNFKDDMLLAGKKLGLKIQKLNISIEEEMLNDAINYNKIKQLLKKINDLEYQKKLLRLTYLQKVQKLLSKEQFKKFRAMFFKMRDAGKKIMKKRMEKIRK